MQVFIAHRIYTYEEDTNEDGTIIGVFESKEKAEQAINEDEKTHGAGGAYRHSVTEHDVPSPQKVFVVTACDSGSDGDGNESVSEYVSAVFIDKAKAEAHAKDVWGGHSYEHELKS